MISKIRLEKEIFVVCALSTAALILGFLKCHAKRPTIQRPSCCEKAKSHEAICSFP